jgi:hypothetical protein
MADDSKISLIELVNKVNAARRYIARYADTNKPKQKKKIETYTKFLKTINDTRIEIRK